MDYTTSIKIKRKYCTKKNLILSLNTLNQFPERKKNKKIRSIQYYNNLLDSEEACNPIRVAIYLHELKSYIFNPEESYEIDKEYFTILIVLFTDLYNSTLEFTNCTVPIIKDERLNTILKLFLMNMMDSFNP